MMAHLTIGGYRATYENRIKNQLRFLGKKSAWYKYDLTMMRQLTIYGFVPV